METISATGIQVVAISYDSVEILEKFAEQEEIKFKLLSDEDSTAIKAFGILNEEVGGRQAGIPYPGTFLVGKDGKVKAYLPGSTRVRHTTEALIEATKSLQDGAADATDGQ